MDWTTAAIFGVGVLAVVLPPPILNRMTARVHARERLADLERQDRVAHRTAETAELLSQAQQLTIQKTDEVAVRVESTTTEVRAQLTQIHTLVNSNLTTALQGELDQTRRSLVLLYRLAVLTPGEATVEELAVIEQTRAHIAELEANLVDRATQTKIADGEISR